MTQLLKNISLFLTVLCCATSLNAQFYNGSDITFGQNRVQYNSFVWQYHHYQRFKVYYYAQGDNHAVYVAKSAQRYLHELEETLDFHIDDDLEFIVYNSQSEFKESNIGLRNEGSSNIGGTTRIAGEKIFVYYEGDHEKLDRQIRSGIARVIAFKMMYGENWREAIKNTSLLSMPEWYIEGFTAYTEGEWNTELDNKLKSFLKSSKYKNLNHLRGENARLVGYAMWHYIAEIYGEKVIPNILYMTRLSKSVESGFVYVLGNSLDGINRDFKAYYHGIYDQDLNNRKSPVADSYEIKSRKNRKYYQYTVSADGRYAAYTTNELGQYKVYIYDTEEDKLRRIAKGNHKLNRLPDYSFPVLAWHPSNKILSFVEEKKGSLILNIYDVEAKKNTERPMIQISKVLDMNYSSNGKQLVMSAVVDGKTDIFIYNVIGGNKIQLTNDIFDDLYPSFVENDTKVIFSSNRLDDTIRKNVEIKTYGNNLDIFVIDVNKPKKPLQRITETPSVDEKMAFQYDENHYTFISDENGIYNRFIAYYDSTISYIDTSVHYKYFSVTDRMSNYHYSVLEHEVSGKNINFMILEAGKYKFYSMPTKEDVIYEDYTAATHFKGIQLKLNNIKREAPQTEDEIIENKHPAAIDIDNYQFESDKEKLEEMKDTVTSLPTVLNKKFLSPKDSALLLFELPRPKLYKINFATEYVVSQFDNSFLNQTYQRLSPNGFQNPGFNGIVKLGLIDVFEDYRIIGGFRYPLNFRNTEYMLSFENLKNRVDKKFLVSRRAYDDNLNDFLFKIINYEFKYNIKYPFSEVASLRFTTGLRLDQGIVQTVSPGTLAAENVNELFGQFKLEYVYDITRPIATNIMHGARFKMWGEMFHQVDERNTDFFTFGLDFRHYQKIHRTMTFASRIAASTSIGSQRLVYFMGGVDNWIGAKFDPTAQISPRENYQFQTIATPMRGFIQNARNGNSFAVINNEYRLPPFQYFSRNPIKSDFIRNFMMIGFFDVGTAWTGWNPYDLENSFNTSVINGKNYEVIIENQKDPILYGFGGGLRTTILGYYLRWDIAWGIDDGVVLKPVNYFSLSLDF